MVHKINYVQTEDAQKTRSNKRKLKYKKRVNGEKKGNRQTKKQKTKTNPKNKKLREVINCNIIDIILLL